MRMPSYAKDFMEKKNEYEKRGQPVPDAVWHVFWTKSSIDGLIRTLGFSAETQAISKECQEVFAKIDDVIVYDDIPETLANHYRMCIQEIQKLRDDLFADKEKYILREMTLTRAGRRRMRETWERLCLSNRRINLLD